MTSEIEMKQNSEDTIEEVDTGKQKKIQEKLKDMGVMPGGNNEQEKEADKKAGVESQESDKSGSDKTEVDTSKSRRFTPILVTVLLAFASAGILAYTFMSDEATKLLSLKKTPDTAVNKPALVAEAENTNSPDFQNSAGNQHIDSQNRDYRAVQEQYRNQSHKNHEQWVARQRAEFDKRRAEFMKQNAQAQAQYNQPGFNQSGSNQAPANLSKNNNPQVYKQPQWVTSTSPELPQWVKDQQAEAEKQRAEYMKEIKKQQEEMYTNRYNGNYSGYRRPEYFNHPRMNINQSQQNNSVPQAHAQQPAVAYQQNQRQYYNPYNNTRQPVYNNAPSYRYGPYYAPYGWQGRPYR